MVSPRGGTDSSDSRCSSAKTAANTAQAYGDDSQTTDRRRRAERPPDEQPRRYDHHYYEGDMPFLQRTRNAAGVVPLRKSLSKHIGVRTRTARPRPSRTAVGPNW